MTYHFLLIDDEHDRRILSIPRLLKAVDERFLIDCSKPWAFEDQLSRLKRTEEHFGVILDNRLDQQPVEDGKPRSYRGLTVAQEIRTRANDEQAWLHWTYPVILLSMQERLERFYKPDSTGHDLFDAIYAKEEVSSKSEQVARELISLVDGYVTLRQAGRQGQSAETRLLLLLGENVSSQRLDPRVQERLLGGASFHPCHVDAQFIMQKLLLRPGLLIGEELLAARLGVDLQKSKDWSLLREKLGTLRYRGIFHAGWERWWARDLEAWWRQLPSHPRALSMLEAGERVDVLRKDLGLEGLEAAEPIQPSYSTRFWTICSETKRPLDRADAVRIAEPEPEPWQEPRYLSLNEALQGMTSFEIHSLDKERVEALRHEAEDDE